MRTRTNLVPEEVGLNRAELSRTGARIHGEDRPLEFVEKARKIEIDMYDCSVRGESQNRSRESHHEKIKVIVVPFTHTDPGWLRTFDSYTKDTDDTLNAMFDFLSKHTDMTFMWAETIFLDHWWRKQDDLVRNLVKQWVKQGRLDLVTGSWVMTDEANAYFPVTVDNIVEGFQFIKKEFGIKPSVLFSLDPFGHSNSIAYLYSQADDTSESDVWTHVFPYSHYDIPSTCGPDSSMCCEIDVLRYYKHYQCGGDVRPINRSNVARKAEGLSKQLMLMSKIYESNVVIMFYGDDFRFTTSFEWQIQYDALRLLFDEINSKKQIEIGFGTITSFFEELEQWYAKNGRQPPSLKGDFFPYDVFILNEMEEEDFYLNGTSVSTFHNITNGMLKGVVRINKKYIGVTPNFLIYLSNGGAYEMNIRDDEYEELLRRKRGEFFPMPTSLVLEDSHNRITVSSNVPHGCREICSGFEAIIGCFVTERIIHSDDGHGLGSDSDSIPNDNLPVDMRFTILVEDLNQAENDSSRFTAHTTGGHITVQSTIYPPVVLITTSNSTLIPPSVGISSLPCELQLLGVRPLPDNRRLLTIFHHGTRATSLTRDECEDDLQKFLKSFLVAMNVTEVEEADLSGLNKAAKVVSVTDYVPSLKPFKFLSLLLTVE
ncbi:hypothetical protein GCK32_006640 [Trichostrongylus colubriformis]|uniref:Glycoside hydrolase family 38 N-terminal domain-containing protein n=1 Tax=Trichostrongylus colubriformis TaxID=6319 RepID=A0AAN8FFH5_TRICO